MSALPPVQVLHLFPQERARLLDLLRSLSPEQWSAPTSCPGWSVKDVAAHILGDDFGNLSGGRDGFSSYWFIGDDWDELVAYVNRQNETWVESMRRLSPQILVELLEFSGDRSRAYFEGLDLGAPGPTVSWAGPGPKPMWLHVAREYTERWMHQTQIREAVDAPGLYERDLFHPVLSTFIHAMPVAFQNVDAAPGALVKVVIDGEGGGEWSLVRSAPGWDLVEGTEGDFAALVRLDEVTAWKLWTKGLSKEEARPRVRFEGDQRLAEPALRAVAIIA